MKRLTKKKYSKETLQKICDFVKNKNKFNFKIRDPKKLEEKKDKRDHYEKF